MEKIVEVYDVTSSKIKNMQLNFYVNREDITALMGNHNCGKTYILELLLGYSPYETGTIKIFGNKNIIVEGPSAKDETMWFGRIYQSTLRELVNLVFCKIFSIFLRYIKKMA